jgi:hypothetical protein
LRALVVRLSSIGDVVHTLPAAAALQAHGWDVGWLAEPASRPLLEGNPAVSRVAVAPRARAFRLAGALAALRALRADAYDVALDLQGLWKSAAWARLSGAPRVLGFGRSWRREPASAFLLGETAELPPEAVHVIDKNLALLRRLGIETLGSRSFPLPDTRAEATSAERGLSSIGLEAFVVLNAGGGWASKLWPPERFGALGVRARSLWPTVSPPPREARLSAAFRPRFSSSSSCSGGRVSWSPPTRARCTWRAPSARPSSGSTGRRTRRGTARSLLTIASSGGRPRARHAIDGGAPFTTASWARSA